MKEHFYFKKFNAWCQQQGVAVTAVPYERPEAGGMVAAWHLQPAKSSGHQVIFAHGTGNDALYPQLQLFQTLLSRGQSIFTFDLDGHGRRSTTSLLPTVAVNAAAQALVQAHSLNPHCSLHLIGFSLGAALSLTAIASPAKATGAKDLPDIQSVAIIAMPIEMNFFAPAHWREAASLFSRPVLKQWPQYGFPGILPALGPFRRKHYPIRLGKEFPSTPLAYVKVVAQMVENLHLKDLAARLKCPALLLYGHHDLLAPPAQGQSLHRVIPSSKFVVFDGETHFSLPFRTDLAETIAYWIREHG